LFTLLFAGLVAAIGCASVQPLLMPHQVMRTSTVNLEVPVQATEPSAQQTADRILVLNVSVNGVEVATSRKLRADDLLDRGGSGTSFRDDRRREGLYGRIGQDHDKTSVMTIVFIFQSPH
jgi:hypothetical protein